VAINIDPAVAGNVLFSAYVAQLELQGVTLPARQGMVPGGLIAYDDAMIAGNMVGITRGMPAQQVSIAQHPIQTLLYYEFSITLLRKVAAVTGIGRQGGIPPASKLADEFVMIAQDAGEMIAAAVQLQVNQAVVPIGIPFAYGPVDAVGPEGELAGNRISFQFQAGCSRDGAY
jgi:hypothetical protein